MNRWDSKIRGRTCRAATYYSAPDREDCLGLAKRVEDGIARSFGFRVSVIVRTVGEMKDVVRRNPFAKELRIDGREVFIYYANGLARPVLPWTTVEKAPNIPGTGRNWNSVTKLLEMAEAME